MSIGELTLERRPSDWRAIREICCLTGNAGDPISRERWPFFGEFWTGAYRKILPEWTWVARSSTGETAGYLTGCPDSSRLARARILRFDLPLLLKVLTGMYPKNGDTRRFAQRLFGLSKGPERRFPSEVRRVLRERYPAHLHINLRDSYRGSGLGRKLTEAFFAALVEEHPVPGVHVFCGPKPKVFYEKMGFNEIAAIDFTPTARVYCMARLL